MINIPANAAVDTCIGNNFEQQAPVPDVQLPTVTIESMTSVNEGETIILTANATVDTQNNGIASFFWCVQGATLEPEPASPDYRTVRFTAPFLSSAGNGKARVAVQVGDDLGYVDIAVIIIDITPNPNDTDKDGLPDDWEMQYFGSLSQDGTGDFDGDGYSDLEEYENSTDPADPNDTPVTQITCTFSVPSAYPTIQEAINAAFTAGGGQVCVSKGTYVENITIKQGVWLTSTSKDPADTIIDGNGIHDVVVIHGSDTGGIMGFTIQNSQPNGNFAGIKCEGNETLTIANCIIKNNNHGINFGGNSKPLIVNNVITDNTGDGIHSNGNAPGMIYNNIIVNNCGKGISYNGQFTLSVGYNNIWGNDGKKNCNVNLDDDSSINDDSDSDDNSKDDVSEDDASKDDDSSSDDNSKDDVSREDNDDDSEDDISEDKNKNDKEDRSARAKPENTGSGKDSLPGIDNISADPLFAAPDTGNYHLNPGSPCIDTGKPEYTDKDNSRSDMGVYGGTWENLISPDPAVVESSSLAVSLDFGEADLAVYDNEDRECSRETCRIPGAAFKHENGKQTVTLPQVSSGTYRSVIKGRNDSTCALTVSVFKNGKEISSETREIKVNKHKVKKAELPLLFPGQQPDFIFCQEDTPRKPDGTLLEQDLTGDNQVNIIDIMKIAPRWGAKKGDLNYDEFYDFNENGEIDINDIVKIAGGWFTGE